MILAQKWTSRLRRHEESPEIETSMILVQYFRSVIGKLQMQRGKVVLCASPTAGLVGAPAAMLLRGQL